MDKLVKRLRTDRYDVAEHGAYARGWNDCATHIERCLVELATTPITVMDWAEAVQAAKERK